MKSPLNCPRVASNTEYALFTKENKVDAGTSCEFSIHLEGYNFPYGQVQLYSYAFNVCRYQKNACVLLFKLDSNTK